MAFTVHTLYRLIFKHWRQRRFRLFLDYLRPTAADSVLDVGGYPGNWVHQPVRLGRVDTVNPDATPGPPAGTPYPIRALTGDGCRLPMADASYDIGFSNSVIEHVGSWERQQQFAAELRRVAGALWVQTPAYECPIEPHYLAPFVHYAPPALRKRILPWCSPWVWLERPSRAQIGTAVEGTRLLRKSEMARLFPDCRILTERMLGIIPKSYIAFRPRASMASSAISSTTATAKTT